MVPRFFRIYQGHLLPVRLLDIKTTFDNTRRGNAGTPRQDHGKREGKERWTEDQKEASQAAVVMCFKSWAFTTLSGFLPWKYILFQIFSTQLNIFWYLINSLTLAYKGRRDIYNLQWHFCSQNNKIAKIASNLSGLALRYIAEGRVKCSTVQILYLPFLLYVRWKHTHLSTHDCAFIEI